LSPRTLKTIRLAYSTAHVFLWCLLAIWAAVLLFSIPRISEARAVAERELAQQISAENRFFCEKWGLRANTHEHVICTMDLNDIRARTEERLTEDRMF
jgi:hypothetical protein